MDGGGEKREGQGGGVGWLISIKTPKVRLSTGVPGRLKWVPFILILGTLTKVYF